MDEIITKEEAKVMEERYLNLATKEQPSEDNWESFFKLKTEVNKVPVVEVPNFFYHG